MSFDIATLIAPVTAWMLGTLISLIVLYWVIRLAVVGALRSHDDYRAREGRN